MLNAARFPNLLFAAIQNLLKFWRMRQTQRDFPIVSYFQPVGPTGLRYILITPVLNSANSGLFAAISRPAINAWRVPRGSRMPSTIIRAAVK